MPLLFGIIVAFVVDMILSAFVYLLVHSVFPMYGFWDIFKIVLALGLVVFVNASLAKD